MRAAAGDVSVLIDLVLTPADSTQKFIIPVLTLNTIADIWGPDGASFRPERWLEGSFADPGALPHGPYSNILSFLDGPRVCIGWRLGKII